MNNLDTYKPPFNRPELNLLLYCSRTSISAQNQEKILHLVQQPLDWKFLIEMAHLHKVTPLVYSQLNNLCRNSIPSEIAIRLEKFFSANAIKNMALTGEMLKLVKIFQSHHLAVFPFKGSILAKNAYGNIALREFLDLDLLVSESDVVEVSQILIKLGYSPQFTLTKEQQLHYIQSRHELSFWHPEKKIAVDLHWSVLPKNYSFSPNPSLLWKNPQKVDFGNHQIETLSPENLLLFLCAHNAKHNWSCLGWICDVGELIRSSPNLDWDWIETHGGQLGTKRMLHLGLTLVNHLFEVHLPAEMTKTLEANIVTQELAFKVQQDLFTPKKLILGVSSLANLYLQTMETKRDITQYWFDKIFRPTPLEWAYVNLPKPLFFLYYPLRTIRLILKQVRRIVPKLAASQSD
jgi:hypothetical protein